VSDLEDSFQKYLDMKKGLIPQSEFFMMNKIKTSDPKGLDEQPKTAAVLSAVVTVHRFKLEGLVFRSLDMVKGIQKSLKGGD